MNSLRALLVIFLINILLYAPAAREKKHVHLFSQCMNLFDFDPGVSSHEWKSITVHHSATKGGSAYSFDKYHKEKGWGGLAYHFVLNNGFSQKSHDGRLEIGYRWKEQDQAMHLFRPWVAMDSIAVCYVGNFDTKQQVTAQQWDKGVWLIRKLMKKYKLSTNEIYRHCDIDSYERYMEDGITSTSCPGKKFPFDKLLETMALEE